MVPHDRLFFLPPSFLSTTTATATLLTKPPTELTIVTWPWRVGGGGVGLRGEDRDYAAAVAAAEFSQLRRACGYTAGSQSTLHAPPLVRRSPRLPQERERSPRFPSPLPSTPSLPALSLLPQRLPASVAVGRLSIRRTGLLTMYPIRARAAAGAAPSNKEPNFDQEMPEALA